MTRIFHACDVHGNEILWRKFLRMAEYHKAETLIMAGDLTGKAIIPIVQRGENDWYCAPWGKEEKMGSRNEVEAMKERIMGMGYYPYETDPREVEELQANPGKVKELFNRLMVETLKRWMDMAEDLPKDVTLIMNPGNDDPFVVDDVIKGHGRVVYPLGRVVEIGGRYSMVSCEWVNPTPWRTPRECSEGELKRRIEDEIGRVDDHENLICNLHAPPYDTNIDLAPKLDKNLKPITDFGVPVMIHVGSRAVREVIEEYKPLLTLHGHIHESSGFHKLDGTICLNPGSEYESGILRGYVIDLPPREFNFWRVEG
jgi:Icc-related predicted phosphoesterase